MCALLPAAAVRAEEPGYDVAFRGGTLYREGRGLEPGDLAVRGDRIVAVGEAPGRAAREIDAEGLVVAPGFIDLHNHTDELYRRVGWLPLPDAIDGNENYLTQGVTTIVTGNCGSGPAGPDDVADWLERADALPFGTNVIHLVPHGQLRLDVMGEAQADRPDPRPTADELRRMREAVDASMRAGAWGLSTGLEYDPGARAGTDELVALARVVARHRGVYASHTRHEGPDPAKTLASYAEAIEIGERAGVPAHISHIKLSGPPVHDLADEVISLVEAARGRGVRVTADQYPYTAGSTALSVLAPVEMRDGTSVLDRHCEGERAELRAAIAGVLARELPPGSVQIAFYPWRWSWQGRRLSEIAASRGEDPVDVAVGIACGWPGVGVYHVQSEAVVRAFATRDWVATASDATALHPWLGRFGHPRAYGTFPRKLRRYALDEPVVDLAFALRSMTALPADILSLADRGRLREGAFADVVVFDPERIRDRATFESPGLESEGIRYLLVNGVLAVDEDEVTGRRAGRALRHQASGQAGLENVPAASVTSTRRSRRRPSPSGAPGRAGARVRAGRRSPGRRAGRATPRRSAPRRESAPRGTPPGPPPTP